jgi:putative ABC transport system permease protein
MLFTEAVKLALQSLWANKMRTILTLLGVVMGVASVIMVVTLVNGANTYVATKLIDHGADVFTVRQMPGVIFSAEEYFKYQKRKKLLIEDYEAMRDNCTECGEVGARLDRSTSVVFNRHSTTDTDLRGYTWTMVSLENVGIDQGRGFTPADDAHGTHNVIVGYDIVDNLLGDGDPIGKEIRGHTHIHLSADLWLQRLVGHLWPRLRRRRVDGAGDGRGAGVDARSPPRCRRPAG